MLMAALPVKVLPVVVSPYARIWDEWVGRIGLARGVNFRLILSLS